MADWFLFLAFAALWSALAGIVLSVAGIAHHLAISAVWYVGFVWGAGYIASNATGADRLLTVWLGWLAATVVAGGLVALALS